MGPRGAGKTFLAKYFTAAALRRTGDGSAFDGPTTTHNHSSLDTADKTVNATVVTSSTGKKLVLLELEISDNAFQTESTPGATGVRDEVWRNGAISLLAMLCGSVVYVSTELSRRGLEYLETMATTFAIRTDLIGQDILQSHLHYTLNMSDYLGNDKPLKKIFSDGRFDSLHWRFENITFHKLPRLMEGARGAQVDSEDSMRLLASRAVESALAHPVKINGDEVNGERLFAFLQGLPQLLRDGLALLPAVDITRATLEKTLIDPWVADYTRRLPSADVWVATVSDPIDTMVLELATKKRLPPVLHERAEAMLREACAPIFEQRRAAITALGKTVAKVGHQKRTVNRRTEQYVAGRGAREYGFFGRKKTIYVSREIHDTQTRTVTTLHNGTVEYGPALPDVRIVNADSWVTVD